MKLVRIVSILLAALAVTLAGCQTDGGGAASGSTTNSGSSGGY
jgi:hypothetical protein